MKGMLKLIYKSNDLRICPVRLPVGERAKLNLPIHQKVLGELGVVPKIFEWQNKCFYRNRYS